MPKSIEFVKIENTRDHVQNYAENEEEQFQVTFIDAYQRSYAHIE